FVFVTANWCSGGHEMERTALSDIEVAARLNKAFVPVKLDRDRFPEADLRLQQAVGLLNSTRGWPLCAVLTSDGELLYGSTELRRRDDSEPGKRGLRSMLNELAAAWQKDGTRIAIESAKFSRAMKKEAQTRSQRARVPPKALERTAARLLSLFEP